MEKYETPTVTYYGTVEELTLGDGNSTTMDTCLVTGQTGYGFQGTTPSQHTCKTGN